jgi:hypothetical protein
METPQKVSTTDLIIKVMEEFGETEPTNCLVIFSTEDGNLALRGNVADKATLVGMLQICCQMVFSSVGQG